MNENVLRFDPVDNMWTTLKPTLTAKKSGCAFMLGGCLYAAGGSSTPLSVERYDMGSNTWTAVADMLGGRSSIGSVTIGSTSPVEEQNLFDSLIAKASERHASI
jgi:hypothetical protein